MILRRRKLNSFDHSFIIKKSQKMKEDYWDVTEEQVIEKTGKKIAEWIKVLDMFKTGEKKSNEVVALLHEEYDVPRKH